MVARIASLFFLSLACAVAPAHLHAALPASSSPHTAQTQDRDTTVVPPDTTVRMQEVTVLATRTRIDPETAPVRLTRLDRSDIEETGAQTVGELLEDRSAAYMRNQGPGQLSSISLRGGGPTQTLLLLDGHRISDPQLGQIDLSLLPTSLLEQAELMHGAASPLYGSAGISGVLNLQTRRTESGLQARGTSRVGAFGEREGSGLISGSRGPFSGVVLGTYRTAQNDFSFTDESQFPPATVSRANADREQIALYARLSYERKNQETRLSGWYNDTERGLPGPATAPTPTSRQWDERLRFWIDHERDLSSGRLSLTGSVDRSRLRFASQNRNIDQTGRRLTSSVSINKQHPIGGQWMLAGGLDGYFARARHPSLTSDAREGRTSLFASGTGELGRLTLFPAGRIDVYSLANQGPSVAFNPKVGMNLQPFGTASSWRLKASVGRSFRQPTLNDRFWQPGGRLDLDPERGWSADVGGLWTSSSTQAEVTAFAHFTRNEIVWRPTGRGHFAPENLRRTRTLGLEASAERDWTLADWLPIRSGVTYTFTDARNRSDSEAPTFNEPVRQVPRHQVKGHTSVHVGPFTVDVGARYVGRRFVTSDGSQSLDPHFVLDGQARLAHRIGSTRLTWSVAVENLLDSEYAVVPNRPMPPRHAEATLTIGFNDSE